MRASSRRVLGLAIALSLLAPSATVAATRSDYDGSTAGSAVVTCVPGQAACPIRISFAAGAYSAQASSSLQSLSDVRWFVVHARAGQPAVIVVEGAGPTRGTVYFPGGGFEGQPGGRIYDSVLPGTGDYRIRVTESSMGQPWSGRVDVVVLAY